MIGQIVALLRSGEATAFTEDQWREMIAVCDRVQLTPYLLTVRNVPDWVRENAQAKRQRISSRDSRLKAAYEEIARALQRAGIEFVLLKGVTHRADAGELGAYRMQYDLDLLCGGDSPGAMEVLSSLGYAPHGKVSMSDQHPPPFVRPFEWKWRDDYFDPDMPVSVDVHSSVWHGETDRIDIPGVDEMWKRRTRLETTWGPVPALCAVDRLAFAALHALRHILRNDPKPAHVYELAAMLAARRGDDEFWAELRALHRSALRQAEAVAFRFAHEWFGAPCQLTEMPPAAARWFEDFAMSPLESVVEPNKDVVWLHCALLKSTWDRLVIVRRKLAPGGVPAGHSDSRTKHAIRRAWHHGRTLAPAIVRGLSWWSRSKTSSKTAQTSDPYRSTWNDSIQRR